jgi:hypothetical protein
VGFDLSSRAKLRPRSAAYFTTDSLFDRIGRAVCEADCLPRKELFESWEVARRARRRFRGGRVVDLACGHALVAHLMLILDDSSPTALAVDTHLPKSSAKLQHALVQAWPRLEGRVTFERSDLRAVDIQRDDIVVSAHACGALTDAILERAIAARARVVVLPCCQEKATCDSGSLQGWMDPALAIDATRVATLRARGFAVYTQTIPSEITAKNRLLLAEPNGAKP